MKGNIFVTPLMRSRMTHDKALRNQPLPKYLRKENEQKCEVPPAITLQNRPINIAMYLGLDIIIK